MPYQIDLQGLPRFIAVPKPGQTLDSIDCPYMFVTRATVRDMTVFLLNEPDWVPPKCRETLCQMVNYARLKGDPSENFWEANGFSPEWVEEFERAGREAFLNEQT